MKIKVWTVVVIAAMLLGTSALAGINTVPQIADKDDVHKEMIMSFSPLETTQSDSYVTVTAEDEMTYLHKEGYPILPYKTEVMIFPFGTRIEDVKVTTSEIQRMQLDDKIIPASTPVPFNMKNAQVTVQESRIYESMEPYPSEWITWHTGAGLHNGEHVIFLSIQAFPYRYIPAENVVLCTDEIQIIQGSMIICVLIIFILAYCAYWDAKSR